MNVTLRILGMFLYQDSIPQTSFSICTVVVPIFFKNVLKNLKKIEKIRIDSEKSTNSFQMKKRIGYRIIY